MKLIDVTPIDSIVSIYVEQLTELEQSKRNEDLTAQRAQFEAEKAAAEAKATARASALAKLAELGLTEAEINAL
jgi:hypothetical protein